MNLKKLILILSILIFGIINSKCQEIENGVYKGEKLPFTICYLTINDTNISIEYFFKKSNQIFGHIPAQKMEHGLNSHKSKPIFTSDSSNVYFKKNQLIVKDKRNGKISLYRTTETEFDLRKLRNKNYLFRYSQDTFKALKSEPNFNETEFWKEFRKLEDEKFLQLDENEFQLKLKTLKEKIITGYNNGYK